LSPTAVLPESTTTAATTGDLYPSTTETAAEEPAIGAAPISTLPERTKATEAIPAATGDSAVAPAEGEAAHIKRPYEKPIFSNDEVKPPKIAKTEEEQKQAAASGAADKSVLAGAGPASTAAYTVPEPVPVNKEKRVDEAKPEAAAAPVAIPAASPITPPGPAETKQSKASPDAVAAAAAAINSSKADRAATTGPVPVAGAEPKKPEPAAKRGEEPKAKVDVPTETPEETTAPQAAESEAANKAEELTGEPSAEQQPEKKKKEGFFAKLKRMFK
jgi:hypothetical protein